MAAHQLWSTSSRLALRCNAASQALSGGGGGGSTLLPLFLVPALASPSTSARQQRRRNHSDFFDSYNLERIERSESSSTATTLAQSSPAAATASPALNEGNSRSLVEAFRAATQAERLPALSRLYAHLATLQRSRKRDGRHLLGYFELEGATRALLAPRASHSDEELRQAAATALRMFEDATSLWDCYLRPLDAHWALRAYFAVAQSGSQQQQQQQPSTQAALRELLRLAQLVPGSMQRSADWGLLLSQAAKAGDARGARLIVRVAKRSGVKMEAREKDAFFAALFRGGQAELALRLAMAEEQGTMSGVSLIPLQKQQSRTLGTLLNGLVRANVGKASSSLDEEAALQRREQMRQLASELHNQLRVRASPEEARLAGAEWRALLEHTHQAHGTRAAVSLISEAVRSKRHEPDERTFVALLGCHGAQLADLAEGTELDVLALFRQVEAALGIRASRRAYAIGIAALLAPTPRSAAAAATAWEKARVDPGQVHEAMLLYVRMRSLGIRPNAPALHPLIRAHTVAFVPNLTAALRLACDIRQAAEPVAEVVWIQLLHGCVNARDVGRACTVLALMREDEVGLTKKARFGWTLKFMRLAKSHQEAFAVYEALRDLPCSMEPVRSSIRSSGSSTSHNVSLSTAADGQAEAAVPYATRDWNFLLGTFRRLVYQPDEDDPRVRITTYATHANLQRTLSFVRDMLRFNTTPSLSTFSMLFDFFGKAARPSNFVLGWNDEFKADRANGVYAHGVSERVMRERLTLLSEAIHELDVLLRTTPQLSPDLPLITSIMDAYNRVGFVPRVLEIWRRLILVRAPLSSACICVALDSCGWAGRIDMLRHVWSTAQAQVQAQMQMQMQKEHPIDRSVWNAYVEALARCGAVREAADTAFGEMKDALGCEAMDAQLAKMLLRFSARERDMSMKDNDTLWFDLCDRVAVQAPDVWAQLKKEGVPGATSWR